MKYHSVDVCGGVCVDDRRRSHRISTPIKSHYKLCVSTQATSETSDDATAIPGNTGKPQQSSLHISCSFGTFDSCILFPVDL